MSPSSLCTDATKQTLEFAALANSIKDRAKENVKTEGTETEQKAEVVETRDQVWMIHISIRGYISVSAPAWGHYLHMQSMNVIDA